MVTDADDAGVIRPGGIVPNITTISSCRLLRWIVSVIISPGLKFVSMSVKNGWTGLGVALGVPEVEPVALLPLARIEATDCSLTATMASPARKPASAAGLPGMTLTTRMPQVSMAVAAIPRKARPPGTTGMVVKVAVG